MLGASEQDMLVGLLDAICTKSEKDVLEIIKKMEGKSNALRVYDDFIEIVRQGLLLRVGEKNEKDGELARLATEYPRTISSKMVLELLEKRHLVESSEMHGWTAFTAILLVLVDSVN